MTTNFNDLPSWQKRGVGLFWEDYTKAATNPQTGEAVTAVRHRLKVEIDLPMRDRYSEFTSDMVSRSLSGE